MVNYRLISLALTNTLGAVKQIWTGMTGFIHIKIHARFLYQAGVSERELFM